MGNGEKCNVYCCVYNCKSKYSSGGVVSMHYFPEKGKKKVQITNKLGIVELVDRRMAWILKLKIGKKVTDTMVVCSLHFSEKNHLPRVPGKTYRRICLRNDAVPDQNLPELPIHGSIIKKGNISRHRCELFLNDDNINKDTNDAEIKEICSEVAEEKNNASENGTLDDNSKQDFASENETLDDNNSQLDFASSNTSCDAGIQASTEMFTKECQTPGSRYLSTICEEPGYRIIRRFLSYENLNDTGFEYFCGIKRVLFNGLLDLLGSEQCMKLKYFNAKGKKQSTPKKILKSLSVENQFLMTLIRLRRGFAEMELAIFFQLSQTTVSRILTTWFQFLYLEFKKYSKIMFNCRNKEDIPHCFKSYKHLAVIIDCTELSVEMSSHFQQQTNTYSSYKSTNTVKFLVGINVHGGISFVSDGYEGNISDREIVIKSGFLEFLNPGEEVMADRGFTIRDLLDPLRVKLIIPPFLNGRDALTATEELETKYIARSRIHVERTMHLIKSFRFFKLPIKKSILPMISQMFFVACFLVNFQKPYVS